MNPERTVLIAEDDEDIREVVAEALQANGCDLMLAANGREALEMLRASPVLPRVILLDLMMPELDGSGFLDEQQRDPRLKGIPVVMVTASGRAGRQHVGVEVAAWLFKPIELDELLATVAMFCKLPGLDVVGGGARAERRVAQFLERRRRELATLRTALEVGDHEELRAIGHNLKGCGTGFGFPDLTEIGARLEAAARLHDHGGEGAAIADLERFFAAR